MTRIEKRVRTGKRSEAVPANLLAALRLGFKLFALPAGKKGLPVLEVDWPDSWQRPTSPDDLEAWLRAGFNIGIVTGWPSRIVVVDTDSRSAEAWARDHLPATPLLVQTARGWHRYYRRRPRGWDRVLEKARGRGKGGKVEDVVRTLMGPGPGTDRGNGGNGEDGEDGEDGENGSHVPEALRRLTAQVRTRVYGLDVRADPAHGIFQHDDGREEPWCYGYVLAPGSTHPSGARYSATGTWEEVEIEDLPVYKEKWVRGGRG